MKFLLKIYNRLKTEEGQDLAEYALLVGLMAVVVMIAVAALGDGLLAYNGSVAAAIMGW
jgi:Flp pilus assembly pilin Flp